MLIENKEKDIETNAYAKFYNYLYQGTASKGARDFRGNMIKEEIFTKISRGDNIFMVGYVKQSIYRFRSSEPELFKSKCVTYKKEEGELNRKVVLSKNFRSRKEV